PPCRQKEGLAATEETASPYPAAEAGKLCSRLSRYALSRPTNDDLERLSLIEHQPHNLGDLARRDVQLQPRAPVAADRNRTLDHRDARHHADLVALAHSILTPSSLYRSSRSSSSHPSL